MEFHGFNVQRFDTETCEQIGEPVVLAAINVKGAAAQVFAVLKVAGFEPKYGPTNRVVYDGKGHGFTIVPWKDRTLPHVFEDEKEEQR